MRGPERSCSSSAHQAQALVRALANCGRSFDCSTSTYSAPRTSARAHGVGLSTDKVHAEAAGVCGAHRLIDARRTGATAELDADRCTADYTAARKLLLLYSVARQLLIQDRVQHLAYVSACPQSMGSKPYPTPPHSVSVQACQASTCARTACTLWGVLGQTRCDGFQ